MLRPQARPAQTPRPERDDRQDQQLVIGFASNEGGSDRKTHPERMDGAGPEQEQRPAGGEVVAPEEPPHPLPSAFGHIDQPLGAP